jgi:hypothetical protein
MSDKEPRGDGGVMPRVHPAHEAQRAVTLRALLAIKAEDHPPPGHSGSPEGDFFSP